MSKKLRVAITHDVDRTFKSYHYFSKIIRAIISLNGKMLITQIKTIFSRENTYWNFQDILKIEKNNNIRATYFFLNETLKFKLFSPSNWVLSLGRYNIQSPKMKRIIKKVANSGHEIGVHGSFDSYKNIELLKKEKETLEKILNGKVTGIRQHHLNRDDTTWEIQHEVGFKYDSSLGFNDGIGYPDEKIRPFKPLSNEFIVFPMALMDFTFSNTSNKWEKLEYIIKQTIENEGVLVLNWHTDTFSLKEFPDHQKDFLRIISLLKSRNAEFLTLKECYDNYISK
tara:strand:+ start:20003 stop:20851 length:849 start_codon:yes stop_codon:yes gene_type:complete